MVHRTDPVLQRRPAPQHDPGRRRRPHQHGPPEVSQTAGRLVCLHTHPPTHTEVAVLDLVVLSLTCWECMAWSCLFLSLSSETYGYQIFVTVTSDVAGS